MTVLRFFMLPLVLLLSLQAHAETPQEVASSLFAAMAERGMNAVPDFTHPDEQAKFKEMVIGFFLLINPQSEKMRHEAFGFGATPDELKAMPPQEFMRKFVKVIESRFRSVDTRFGPNDILGAVEEGELRHVVVRTRLSSGGMQTSQVEVITFRKFENTWRTTLSAQVEGMAQALKLQAQSQR